MRHETSEQFQPPSEPLVFEARNFLLDMIAAGAVLKAVRTVNPGGLSVDGEYVIEAGASLPDVVEVLARYRPAMEAEPLARGRVSEAILFNEAYDKTSKIVGCDFVKAIVELDRLDFIARRAGEKEEQKRERYCELSPDYPKEIRFSHIGSEVWAEHAASTDKTGKRIEIYTRHGIDEMRVSPRGGQWSPSYDDVEAFQIGTGVEPRSDVERGWVKTYGARLRKKADEIISAYDAWRRTCESIRTKCGLRAAQIAADIAGENFVAAVDCVREIPISSFRDAVLKARIVRKHAQDYQEEFLDELAKMDVGECS